MYQNLYQINPISTVLYVMEGEDEGGQGQGGQGQGSTGGSADLEAKIAEAVEKATKGLKAKNDELLGSLKTTKDKLKAFDGWEPERLKQIQERLDEDEDAKMFAEGKKIQVIEKYTERMRAQHATELEEKNRLIEAEKKRSDVYKGAVLDNQIRAAANGLHKGAVEDALLHARQIFTLDEDGNAVQLDSEGNPVIGKDGKNPFSPAEWIELQKELKPHWFPSSTSGSGSGNARDGNGGHGKSIKRADFNALTPARQREVVTAGTKIVD